MALTGLLGVVMFTLIIVALVGVLMVAKNQLVPAAEVKIIINQIIITTPSRYPDTPAP